jgi:hypothetical protein
MWVAFPPPPFRLTLYTGSFSMVFSLSDLPRGSENMLHSDQVSFLPVHPAGPAQASQWEHDTMTMGNVVNPRSRSLTAPGVISSYVGYSYHNKLCT